MLKIKNNELYELDENGKEKKCIFDYNDVSRDAFLEGRYKLRVARIGEIQNKAKSSNRAMSAIEEQEINECMNDCNAIVDYLRLNNIEFEFDDYGCVKLKNRVR